jgi:hypothetical protein
MKSKFIGMNGKKCMEEYFEGNMEKMFKAFLPLGLHICTDGIIHCHGDHAADKDRK